MADQLPELSDQYDADAEFEALPRASEDRGLAGMAAGEPVGRRLGIVVTGSLSKGLEARLDRGVNTEELAVGSYVVVRGERNRFFSMITDVRLDAANPEILASPPDIKDDFLRGVHVGTSLFGALHLSPMLVLEEGGSPKPVKTVPGHFSEVRAATQHEVNEVFGEEGEQQVAGETVHYFHVGQPLDMEDVKVTLSLERLVERSSGVFGKSGTGKTFLSRLLLAGIIRNGVAVNLIFDMHNEYGWEGSSEGASRKVKGLKQVFPDRVSIFTLDDASSRRRGSNPDLSVVIAYDQIEPDDLEMLQGIMNLSEAQIGAIYALHRRLGREWLASFLNDDWLEANWGDQAASAAGSSEIMPDGSLQDDRVPRAAGSHAATGLKNLADALGQTYQTLAALRRRFERFRRYHFIQSKAQVDVIDRLFRTLDAGHSVVLEFGRYGNSLDAYVFVANFLTRRLHRRYVEQKEEAFGDKAAEPRPLVITIEEAHKFLDPAIAGHTIFGTIARELRKYNVTLLIVDQRPSRIDPEVMSQVGTRVTALLDEENDISAVLMGVSGASGLKEVLARLDTRQQALILGHAVPMPVVVQTRSYDLDFYKAMGFRDDAEVQSQLAASVNRMRGDEDFEGFD